MNERQQDFRFYTFGAGAPTVRALRLTLSDAKTHAHASVAKLGLSHVIIMDRRGKKWGVCHDTRHGY